MSEEAISRKLDELKSRDDLKSSKPTMRIDIFLQEAEVLFNWCKDDKTELKRVSLDLSFVENLPVRTGALRTAETNWITALKSVKKKQELWEAAQKDAKQLRKILFRHFSFALKDLPDELKKLKRIKEGWSNADMILDLNVLAELGSLHKERLEAVGMDLSLLDEAKAKSDSLWNILTESTTAMRDIDPLLELRNKSFHHLKEAVDKIREAGKYAFSDNSSRCEGYCSDYIRKMNRKSRGKDEGPEE